MFSLSSRRFPLRSFCCRFLSNVNVITPIAPPITPEPHSKHELPHRIWDLKEIQQIPATHVEPKKLSDKLAFYTVQGVRLAFDLFTGYALGIRGEQPWIRRIVFLETIAGVPGMVGAMLRHLQSLRLMRRDNGWIHTLLEEAENERMHLMVALDLSKPGFIMRSAVIFSQSIFFVFYSLAYAISPLFCHRFVGYLEQEAVRTYTHLLSEIDKGNLPLFSVSKAPFVAIDYYRLDANASLRDVFACIRADESHHRDVNHTFSDIVAENKPNPFPPGH